MKNFKFKNFLKVFNKEFSVNFVNNPKEYKYEDKIYSSKLVSKKLISEDSFIVDYTCSDDLNIPIGTHLSIMYKN